MFDSCCPALMRRELHDGAGTPLPGRGVTAVLGFGRQPLRTDDAVQAICIPLHGRLRVRSIGDTPLGGDARVERGHLLVTDSARLQAAGRGRAAWVALIGSPEAWRSLMHERVGVSPGDAWLFPARHPADHDLRRRALRLARAISTGGAVAVAADDLVERIAALQAAFAATIRRCPGRTHAQRCQVFARLQRVRAWLADNCCREIDNRALADMANYSPTHFVRAFREVFDDTPHAFLVRQRLERARQLLRKSPLAINEIAQQIGFENASAFSRVFRRRYGATAGTVRREYATSHAAAG